jgi:hypothetical protein
MNSTPVTRMRVSRMLPQERKCDQAMRERAAAERINAITAWEL